MLSNRKKLALIPAALLLVMALLAVKLGTGNIQAYPVRYAIEQLQAESRLPTEAELTKAQSAISPALNWQPDNPEYNDYQGRLYHYRAVLSQGQTDQNEALTQALQSYRTSTTLRPQWPYSCGQPCSDQSLAATVRYRISTSPNKGDQQWNMEACGQYRPD